MLTILNGFLTAYGAGRHSVLLTSVDLVWSHKLAFASRVLYQACIGTTKLGIFRYRICSLL